VIVNPDTINAPVGQRENRNPGILNSRDRFCGVSKAWPPAPCGLGV
jgi:hypothetical protein